MYPHLGKSGTSYAQSVKPLRTHMGAPPDPGLLFDCTSSILFLLITALLARKQYKEHPAKVSSMLLYFATIIIHGTYAFPYFI
jgi:hypothetical protein